MSPRDPMKLLVAQALTRAGIAYVTGDGGRNPSGLDFRLTHLGIEIEVKRFHSPRIAYQMARAPDVIAVQGEAAVRWFSSLLAPPAWTVTALEALLGEALTDAWGDSPIPHLWIEAAARAVHDNTRLTTPQPVPMVLYCSNCGLQHIDEGEWATKPHRSHLCAQCGCIWRPADVETVGVRCLPSRGLKDSPIPVNRAYDALLTNNHAPDPKSLLARVLCNTLCRIDPVNTTAWDELTDGERHVYEICVENLAEYREFWAALGIRLPPKPRGFDLTASHASAELWGQFEALPKRHAPD